MSDPDVISATIRTERGTRAARRLRAAGRIPAVLYGHEQQTIALAVPTERVEALVRHGTRALLQLRIDQNTESAVVREMQWDVFGREVLHVDFARVAADETITMDVPITLKGQAPGLKEGGVLDQALHSVPVECSANRLVQQIVVNVNNLHLNDSVQVKDLKLEGGAKVLLDADQLVAQITLPAAEEEAAGAAAGPAEPEVIGREAKEEDESEG